MAWNAMKQIKIPGESKLKIKQTQLTTFLNSGLFLYHWLSYNVQQHRKLQKQNLKINFSFLSNQWLSIAKKKKQRHEELDVYKESYEKN